jgi:hypothetical protein
MRSSASAMSGRHCFSLMSAPHRLQIAVSFEMSYRNSFTLSLRHSAH